MVTPPTGNPRRGAPVKPWRSDPDRYLIALAWALQGFPPGKDKMAAFNFVALIKHPFEIAGPFPNHFSVAEVPLQTPKYQRGKAAAERSGRAIGANTLRVKSDAWEKDASALNHVLILRLMLSHALESLKPDESEQQIKMLGANIGEQLFAGALIPVLRSGDTWFDRLRALLHIFYAGQASCPDDWRMRVEALARIFHTACPHPQQDGGGQIQSDCLPTEERP
jgi:hypothetical protein